MLVAVLAGHRDGADERRGQLPHWPAVPLSTRRSVPGIEPRIVGHDRESNPLSHSSSLEGLDSGSGRAVGGHDRVPNLRLPHLSHSSFGIA